MSAPRLDRIPPHHTPDQSHAKAVKKTAHQAGRRVKWDIFCKCIPLVATVNTIFNMHQKRVYQKKLADQVNDPKFNDSYHKRIVKEKTWEQVVLLIPIIGQIAIGISTIVEKYTQSNTSSPSPKIEEFINDLRNENGVEVRGNETDTWHEIVFDNQAYDKTKVNCPWKLHISPGSDTMGILDAIKPVLLKNRPYCKIVQNQEKLMGLENSKDVNNKHVYKGKCITIYPKSEQEALSLAIELNEVIIRSNLINSDNSRYPCTDRPLGASGYLWSRNDLAGGPIDELSLQDSDHAHAMPGNYDTTVILPMIAYDFETDASGRKAYTEWYDREFPNFQRIIHKDIFVENFGPVHWVGDAQSDQGRFENAIN